MEKQNGDCTKAGAVRDDNCGQVMACNRDNVAVMLPRWQACLDARKEVKRIFAIGAQDVERAKKAWANDKSGAKDLITSIGNKISGEVDGHDKQITLVTGSVRDCQPFAKAAAAQQNKRGQ